MTEIRDGQVLSFERLVHMQFIFHIQDPIHIHKRSKKEFPCNIQPFQNMKAATGQQSKLVNVYKTYMYPWLLEKIVLTAILKMYLNPTLFH